MMQPTKVLAAAASCLALWMPRPAFAETQWRIEPSLPYDVVCLTGILADDPYITQFYGPQRALMTDLLPADVIAAGARVHLAFKAEGVPTAGALTLIYSAGNLRSLEDLIGATQAPAGLRTALEASPYWNAERWAVFEQARPDLLTYLRGLQRAGFTAWWSDNARAEVEEVLVDLRPRLAALDIRPLLEKTLNRSIDPTITVHATRFCRPFGARLLGTNFLIDVVGKRDPFRSVGAGALHEMTHPPFDEGDPRIVALIAHLEQDPTLKGRFDGRPRDSGYNTFSGFINEDVTRTLDQIIGERVGVTFMDDAHQRWREQEGGFHMAAAVFYELMKAEAFLDGEESVTEFLDRMRLEGRLAPDRISEIVRRVEGPALTGDASLR